MGEYVPAALYTEEKHRWDIINRHLEQGNFLNLDGVTIVFKIFVKASEARFKCAESMRSIKHALIKPCAQKSVR